MTRRDSIFAEKQERIHPFRFDGAVAHVFDDMASRSIPGYHEAQEISRQVAKRFVTPRSRVYDIGCSTGRTLKSILPVLKDLSVEIIGIDLSEEMIEECRRNLQSKDPGSKVKLLVSSAEEAHFENASCIFLHYVLQFVPKSNRADLLTRINKSLIPSGALLISEKTLPAPPNLETIESFYDEFKRANGYSELEIEQKRKALTGVLVPLTLDENLRLLRDAGFNATVLLQRFQFVTILATKSGI